MKPLFKKLAIAGAILFSLFMIRMVFFSKIRAGYEGIKVDAYGGKGVQNVTSVEGLVFYNPFTQSVIEFPIFISSYDYEMFSINSKDGSKFDLQPSLSLRVIQGSSPKIYKDYRKDPKKIIKEDLVNIIKAEYQAEIGGMTDDDVISRRTQFDKRVLQRLTVRLESLGFQLTALQSGIEYPPSLLKSIEDKNKANQLATKSENEVRMVIAEADKLRQSSKGNADAEIEKARGKAAAIREVADAESYANAKINSSLTPQLIEYTRATRWNGVQPTHVLGSSSYFVK